MVHSGEVHAMEVGRHLDDPEPGDEFPEFYDDITGSVLPKDLVVEARKVEIQFLGEKLKTRIDSTIEECLTDRHEFWLRFVFRRIGRKCCRRWCGESFGIRFPLGTRAPSTMLSGW